jgi:hypothetical protein
VWGDLKPFVELILLVVNVWGDLKPFVELILLVVLLRIFVWVLEW